MGIKRLFQAMGVGGPSVESELAASDCRPGGQLEGRIRVVGGGDAPVDVEYLAIGLTTPIGIDDGNSEYSAQQEFHRQRLTGSFRLDPAARHEMDFRFSVPWETPITELFGQHLHGMRMALVTELEVAGEVARSDVDAVAVRPLPAQERVLDALLRMGFRFSRADVRRGRVGDTEQRLPFYQQIEFFPPAAYAAGMSRLELTFLPAPAAVQVSLVSRDPDRTGRFDVDYATVDERDWAQQVDEWLTALSGRFAGPR